MTDDKIRSIYAKRLSHCMAVRGMDVAELADKSGLSAEAITDYLITLDAPSIEEAVHISEALNVTIDYMIGRKPKQAMWEKFSDGWFDLYRCPHCGTVIGPRIDGRKYCSQCGSRNGGADANI